MIPKNIYIIGGFILIVIIGYLFFSKKETTLYLSIANPSVDIDLLIKIDDKQVFNDTITYHPYKYIIIKEQLGGGFHKVHVSSSDTHLIEESNVFIFLNQHILIEYYLKSVDVGQTATLKITNIIIPLYF